MISVAQIFLNTSYEILCDGPLTSPIDGAPNACADRTGTLVCRDAARLQAKMSHNASAAMALPFVQGEKEVLREVIHVSVPSRVPLRGGVRWGEAPIDPLSLPEVSRNQLSKLSQTIYDVYLH